MFVTKVSTISAMLFTLGCHVIGKTVNGKHIRQAVAYDPVDTGTVDHLAHSLSDGKESARLLQLTTITSCDVPGEVLIKANWRLNVVDSYVYCYSDLYECCGPIQKISTIICNGALPLQIPGRWNDGVCSAAAESDLFVVKSDCCYYEDGITPLGFTLCSESQEKIPGKWNNGVCVAYYAKNCCRSVSGTTSSGNGGTSSSGNGGSTSRGNGGTTSSESSSAALFFWIVFGLLIILVLVLLACYCSKKKPLPTTTTTTTGASSNKPVKEEAVDTEDRSVTDVPPETAAPGSHGPPPPAAAAAPMTLAEISDALVLALRISQTSSNVASTVESVTESANNISEIVAIASALAGVPLEV
jgi:hypothetical protein